MTKVLPCKCKHKDQDQRYGAGNRLHNFCAGSKSGKRPPWRCTVCGDSKQ